MTERLIIQNFAGIEHLDIELGRINIFIGPQASGKSVCVKCLFYFKGCVNSLLRQAIQPQFPSEELKDLFEAGFLVMFAPTAFNSNSTLRYTNGKNFIQIASDGQRINATFSDFYLDLYERTRKAATSRAISSPEEEAFLDTALYTRFRVSASKILGSFGASTMLFVPASRATYSLISNSRANNSFSEDIFVNNFNKFYTSFKRREFSTHYELHNSLIDSLTGEVLRAGFLQEKDEDFLVQSSGIKTPLAIASSGQQEALPVVLTLRHLALKAQRDSQVVIIEEPEAHIHPNAQNELVKLVAAVYNVRTAAIQFFLTTHTPYLLSSFNNLIYAGQLASQLKKNDSAGRKKLYSIVPKELHLHLADFRVYGLENGKAELLIDEETGLLRADTIDSVSDVIGDQFTALMDLDPTTKPSALD